MFRPPISYIENIFILIIRIYMEEATKRNPNSQRQKQGLHHRLITYHGVLCSKTVLLVVTEQIYCNLFISVRLREDLLTHHLPRLNSPQCSTLSLSYHYQTSRNNLQPTSISLHQRELF